jgi:hypothetical protein
LAALTHPSRSPTHPPPPHTHCAPKSWPQSTCPPPSPLQGAGAGGDRPTSPSAPQHPSTHKPLPIPPTCRRHCHTHKHCAPPCRCPSPPSRVRSPASSFHPPLNSHPLLNPTLPHTRPHRHQAHPHTQINHPSPALQPRLTHTHSAVRPACPPIPCPHYTDAHTTTTTPFLCAMEGPLSPPPPT